MLLYDSRVSGNCYKVRLLFAHLELPYERREVDVVERSGRLELLGDLNPGLRVPTLVLDDGRSLGESGAILWLFADGTPYLPTESFERAQVLQWMFFEQYSHEPNIAVRRFWIEFAAPPSQSEAAMEATLTGGYAALNAMERHLADHEFLVAESLHDRRHRPVRATRTSPRRGGFDLAPYPAIQSWLARVAAQPRPRAHRRLTARPRALHASD